MYIYIDGNIKGKGGENTARETQAEIIKYDEKAMENIIKNIPIYI